MPRFLCTLCGECCTGDQVIFLNGDDMERLARHLNLEGEDGLRAGGYVHDGEFSWTSEGGTMATAPRPALRFRRVKLQGTSWFQCPFLEHQVLPSENDHREERVLGTCSLHKFGPQGPKPLVCQLSPLVRIRHGSQNTWDAIAPCPQCPGMGFGPELRLEPPQDLEERLEAEVLWISQRFGI